MALWMRDNGRGVRKEVGYRVARASYDTYTLVDQRYTYHLSTIKLREEILCDTLNKREGGGDEGRG